MSRGFFLLLGLAIGILVGWPLQRLNVKPIVQSILAMELSWLFAAFVCGVAWMMHAANTEGVVAMSFGLSEFLIALLPIILLAAGIHILLRWVPGTVFPSLARNRALILGVVSSCAEGLAENHRLWVERAGEQADGADEACAGRNRGLRSSSAVLCGLEERMAVETTPSDWTARVTRRQ